MSPLLQDFVQSLIYPAVQCEKWDPIVDNSGKTTLSYIACCKTESIPSYPMHYL